jgi:2-desacetyl-2-hydroxyethyl bacteriochlorophyllide A dehydrogenase
MVLTANRIVFPAIKQAEWESVSLPDTLQPTQVLVKAARTLVSAGTETAIYGGTHIGYIIPGARYPRLPFYPGYLFAGTVEAVGAAVSTVQPGDRVVGSMGHQDRVIVDLERSTLERIPEGVSFEQACLAQLSVISMQGVRLARLDLGEHVAVFGQGLIGQFARQLAAINGACRTVAIDLIDARLEVARRHGATHLVNPGRDDPSAGAGQALAVTIAAATEGRGVDVAIEATGNPAAINDALNVVARMGRLILLGSPRGRLEIDPYSDVHSKGVSIIGAHANTTAATANPYHRWTRAEHCRLALELLRQGRLQTEGLITHRVAAAEALPVWDGLISRPQDHLGVIIVWDGEPAG